MNTTSASTVDHRLNEWRHLHKLHGKALKEGNFALKASTEKRIKELKPFYAEFSKAPQTIDQSVPQPEQEPSYLPFNFFCISGSQRAAVLCDRIYDRWLQAKQLKRKPSDAKLPDYRRIIQTILANVLYCKAMGHDGVRFSRDRARYASPSRYRPTIFNERFLTVVDELANLNILVQTKGDERKVSRGEYLFPERAPKKVYGLKQSRIALGPVLIQELAKLSIEPVSVDAAFITEGQEVIILKAGEGSQLLEYSDADVPEVIKQRTQMQIINTMLENAGNLLTPEAQEQFDQRQRFLTRRFTYASLESGGRLWGGFWLNGMKREQRPLTIRLHGEETVELDFKNMIVRLAYIVAEKPCPAGDLYAIPGLDLESRDGVKRVMSTLLFDSSRERDRLPKETAELFTTRDRQKGWKAIHAAILAHHPALKAYLDRGLGHYLQFLESQVLVNVLIRCAKAGIPALPLHDCIVVPRSQRDQAKGYMRHTVEYMFGVGAVIPIEEKGGILS